MNNFLTLIKIGFVLLVSTHICKAQSKASTETPYVPGELIVKFKAGNSAAKTSHLSAKMQARVVKIIPGLSVELWKVEEQNTYVDVLELVEQYKDHPDIEFIEPNYLYTTTEVDLPNDTNFNEQWALHNTGAIEGSVEDADIDAAEAWEIQSESPSIVVGIIDTGVDWRHPDLIDNIWQNLAEDADGDGVVLIQNDEGQWIFDPGDENGIDDDNNGYVDDFIGWNFVEDNNQPFNYEAVELDRFVQAHGTHIAGIIGAAGNNNTGVSGITQNVQMAPLKFITDELTPQGTSWNAARAIEYAGAMGMQISNNSWGGSLPSHHIYLAIQKAAENNHLFVAAAGNGGIDKIGDKIIAEDLYYAEEEGTPFFPASYNFDNMIVVANSNSSDTISNSSNYSVFNVDIAAPGTGIYSCLPYNSMFYQPYGLKSGTSMAAPFVAGTLALLWEKTQKLNPVVNIAYLKNVLLENADILPQLKHKVANRGRLNAHKALAASIDTSYINKYQHCRQRDSLALISVYYALGLETLNPVYKPDGNTIDYYDTWDYENTPMDDWKGVGLNNLGCVSSLILRDFSREQANEIPAEIGNLSDLTELVLSKSSYYHGYYRRDNGFIQDVFSDIDSYEDYVAQNNFTLTIPPEIGQLKKLKKLELAACRLGGTIPTQIGQLTNLVFLNLRSNKLTGEIPIGLYNLTKLVRLDISLNELSGSLLPEIGELKELNTLNLFHNQLSGSIPSSIGSIPLTSIDLGFNNLSGEIPDVFDDLLLHKLTLDYNNLTGIIPPTMSYLWHVNIYDGYFSISNNQLTGCYDPALINIGKDGFLGDILSNKEVSENNNFEPDWQTFLATKEGSCWASATSRVWPGDLNNDGIVSGDDIAFYGLAKGLTDIPREGSDENNNGNTTWVGQLCPDWDSKVYGINAKHSDANGDGLVDTLDYIVVQQNMGLYNPDHYADANTLNYYSNGIQLELMPVDIDGANRTYDLFLKNLYGDQAAIYGVSGVIEFFNGLSDASIEFTDDCINILHSYTNFDKIKNRLVFALTQVDDVNVTCADALARVSIAVEDALAEEDDEFASFKVEGIHTQTNADTGGTVNQSIGATAYSSLSTNTDEAALEVSVSCNPQLCFRGGEAKSTVSGGSPPYTFLWSNGQTSPNIYSLGAGQYSLTVTDDRGIQKVVLVEIEDNAVAAFDENGVLKECENFVIAGCPTDIDYDENIVDETRHIMDHGVYQAGENIYTGARIFKYEEVKLKAGNMIRLNPGFTMDNHTKLDIIIEDCGEEDE